MKSYSAELPGQFGGGTLAIDTSSFPTSFELKLGVSTSANTVATGQAGLTNAHATRRSRASSASTAARARCPTRCPRTARSAA